MTPFWLIKHGVTFVTFHDANASVVHNTSIPRSKSPSQTPNQRVISQQQGFGGRSGVRMADQRGGLAGATALA